MRIVRPILASVRRRSIAVYRSLYFPPSVICIAILVASLFGWQAARQSLDHELGAAEEVRVLATEQSLQTHLASYEQILRGGVGLFQGSDDVTPGDWEHYLGAYNPRRSYPAVQAIGYARVFTPDQLPDIAAYMADNGVPGFTVNPAGERDTYAAVLYLKTIASTTPPAFGFDMYSEAQRRTAMEHARDTNSTIITPSIRLMSVGAAPRPYGFNMYVPYYGHTEPATVSERQQQLQGYVYGAFRADVFFRAITTEMDGKAIGFSVTVNDDNRPFYTSPTYSTIMRDKKESGTITHTLQVYGQQWRISYALDHQLIVSNVQLKRPGGVLFFGIFSAALISAIIYLVLRGRAKDLQAQKERAVELAKDELLSLASHQLRTPATGVKQYVGMVLQGFVGEVSAEQQTLLEKAYASNDRQLRIINEILHLAKIDSGRIVLARQQTNLVELVNDIVNEQRGDIAAANHKLKLRLPKRPIMVHADSHMLRMAIENLLSNAIKYTHPGGSLAVQVRHDRWHAYISVDDSGIGIAAADLDKIFNQFSRLPNELSQRVEGTGIGLYLAKHLVELHQGTIQVESQPGRGSTFTISLPLRGARL